MPEDILSGYDLLKLKYYTRRETWIACRFGEDDFYKTLKKDFYTENNQALHEELFSDIVALTLRYIVYGFKTKKKVETPRPGLYIPEQYVDDVVFDVVEHVLTYAIPHFLDNPMYESVSPGIRLGFLLLTIRRSLLNSYSKIWKSSRVCNPDYDPENPEYDPENAKYNLKYLTSVSLDYLITDGYQTQDDSNDEENNGFERHILPAVNSVSYPLSEYDAVIPLLRKFFSLPCRKIENLVACSWVITDNMIREMHGQDTHANSRTAYAASKLNGLTIKCALEQIAERLNWMNIPVEILDPLKSRANEGVIFEFDEKDAQKLSKQVSKTRDRFTKALRTEKDDTFGGGKND